MSSIGGPNISKSGLVLSLDAANPKSFDGVGSLFSQSEVGPTEHGLSEWYCFITGTATYSAIYEGTIIYDIDPSGTISIVIPETTEPKRLQFSMTAGYRYYANKPIHLMDESEQEKMAPISLQGEYFGNISTRYGMSTYNVYCPSGSGTVYHYDNVTGGVTGTETSSSGITAGEHITFTTTGETTYQTFYSTVPVIMTVSEADGGDRMVLTPASTNHYRRRDQYERTINNTVPSTVTTYYVGDVLPCWSTEIGDGAGGDANQGIGLENLSDTYSWGNTLSDYQIVAPYPNTTISISYYSGSTWILGETHYLSGSTTSPDAAFRDGTVGFGSEGADDSGSAVNLGGGTQLWKWEGDQPFALIINDTQNDEEPLFGWMKSRELRTDVWKNLENKDNYGTIMSGVTYDSTNKGVFTFDGVDGNIQTDSSVVNGLENFTLEFWCKFDDTTDSAGRPLFGSWFTLDRNALLRARSNNLEFYTWTSGVIGGATQVFTSTDWNHIVATYDGSTMRTYVNSIESATSFNQTGVIGETTTTPYDLIGEYSTSSFDGSIGVVSVYSESLTQEEITQNFNTQKTRFGL